MKIQHQLSASLCYLLAANLSQLISSAAVAGCTANFDFQIDYSYLSQIQSASIAANEYAWPTSLFSGNATYPGTFADFGGSANANAVKNWGVRGVAYYSQVVDSLQGCNPVGANQPAAGLNLQNQTYGILGETIDSSHYPLVPGTVNPAVDNDDTARAVAFYADQWIYNNDSNAYLFMKQSINWMAMQNGESSVGFRAGYLSNGALNCLSDRGSFSNLGTPYRPWSTVYGGSAPYENYIHDDVEEYSIYGLGRALFALNAAKALAPGTVHGMNAASGSGALEGDDWLFARVLEMQFNEVFNFSYTNRWLPSARVSGDASTSVYLGNLQLGYLASGLADYLQARRNGWTPTISAADTGWEWDRTPDINQVELLLDEVVNTLYLSINKQCPGWMCGMYNDRVTQPGDAAQYESVLDSPLAGMAHALLYYRRNNIQGTPVNNAAQAMSWATTPGNFYDQSWKFTISQQPYPITQVDSGGNAFYGMSSAGQTPTWLAPQASYIVYALSDYADYVDLQYGGGGGTGYRVYAAHVASWIMGNNSAGVSLYRSENHGVVLTDYFLASNGSWFVNTNSAGESNVEALRALLWTQRGTGQITPIYGQDIPGTAASSCAQ